MIDQVAQGEFDAAADGISITDERKEIVDYSDAYMVVQQKFIVQLDDDRYDTAQALIDDAEAIVATQVGTTNCELAIELVGEDRVQAFDQFGLAVQALIAGDVDAVIIDDAAGLGYVGENADSIKTIDDGLQSDPLGFIFPKGSELVAPVNHAIQQMKDDGTMEELGVKFFTDAFTITYDDIDGVGRRQQTRRPRDTGPPGPVCPRSDAHDRPTRNGDRPRPRGQRLQLRRPRVPLVARRDARDHRSHGRSGHAFTEDYREAFEAILPLPANFQQGLALTLYLTVGSFVVATILGLFLGLARLSRNTAGPQPGRPLHRIHARHPGPRLHLPRRPGAGPRLRRL